MRVWCEKSGSLAGPASRKKRRQDSPRRPPVDGEVRVHAVEQRRAPGGVGVAGAERADLRLLEEVVAPVELVGALAGRDHRDALLARRLGQQVERHAGRADHRRLEVAHDVLEGVGDLLGADLDHVVLGAELLGDLALEGRLVEQRVAEGERERAQLVIGLLDGERGREARVEAAGEVAADRARRRAAAAARSRAAARRAPRAPAPARRSRSAAPTRGAPRRSRRRATRAGGRAAAGGCP